MLTPRRRARPSGSLGWQCQPCAEPEAVPRVTGLRSEQGWSWHSANQRESIPLRVVRGSGRLLGAHRARELAHLSGAGLCGRGQPQGREGARLSHLWGCPSIQPAARALPPQRTSRGAGGSLVEGVMGNK